MVAEGGSEGEGGDQDNTTELAETLRALTLLGALGGTENNTMES